MGYKIKYQLSYNMILWYLSIVGIDSSMINEEAVRHYSNDGIRDIFDLVYETTDSDIIEGTIIPKSSIRIAQSIAAILENTSPRIGTEDPDKTQYKNAVLIIIEAITNLNLIDESKESYLLHFERINSVLQVALNDINKLSLSQLTEIVDEIILNPNKDSLKKLVKKKLALGLIFLLYLAMNPKEDIKDYEMFDKDSASINYNKLWLLAVENIYKPEGINLSVIKFSELGEIFPEFLKQLLENSKEKSNFKKINILPDLEDLSLLELRLLANKMQYSLNNDVIKPNNKPYIKTYKPHPSFRKTQFEDGFPNTRQSYINACSMRKY